MRSGSAGRSSGPAAAVAWSRSACGSRGTARPGVVQLEAEPRGHGERVLPGAGVVGEGQATPASALARTTDGGSLSWTPKRVAIMSRSRAPARFWSDCAARPRNHQTSSLRSPSHRSKSSSSRDLPTPASPTIVTTLHRRSSTVSKSSSCSWRSSTSRPTVRVSTPSTPRARSRWNPRGRSERTTKASTGSSMPFSRRPGDRLDGEPPAHLAVGVGADEHAVRAAPRTAAGWPG